MIVLFSAERPVEKEHEILRKLFSLEDSFLFHYRRPYTTKEEDSRWLDEIGIAYHPRIVLHQNHALMKDFSLKGIHLKSIQTRDPKQAYVSTSFHHPKEVHEQGELYSYFFCSPVFASISKQSYQPTLVWDIHLSSHRSKAVALGGMKEQTVPLAIEKGFHHFAFLGAVWQAEDPIGAFQKILKACPKKDLIA